MIIADNETAVDYLYYEPIAKTVVKLIQEKSQEPLTIGLHGDWGAGKSSALLMIEEAFSSDDRTLCVRFNGWLFEGYDDAKAVLIETIVAALVAKRSVSTKVKEKAAEVLKNVNWFKVARTVGGAALTFTTGIPSPDLVKGIGDAAKGLLSDPTKALTGEMFTKVLDGAAAHIKSGESDTAPQRMHAFRKDFEDLLNLADIDRLIVLIDDLDRCLPRTAIATLEAVRLFLFVPRAAFVIAADEGMIEYSVRHHFPDLPVTSAPGSYARNYLEKLIQVPFRMPALGSVETRIYLTLLISLTEGLSDMDFQRLIPVARNALRRPWLDTGFDRGTIEKALGSLPPQVETGLQLATEITPVLTDGARGNPRQIKRFVNTLDLRLTIAEERGFRGDLRMPVLAKLMLAERFAPEVFDAIALDLDVDGKSKIIAELEGRAATTSKPKTGSKSSTKATEPSGSKLVQDWPNLEWAKRWGRIKVSLSDVDLRPYFFVSRDRRTAMASAIAAGPIEELVERLSATSLGAKSEPRASLSALTAVDAERVFHALSAKITNAETLNSRPAAADGLATLCSARPELRDALLTLLDRLPTATVGAWVVTGWGAAVGVSQAPKFKELLKKWSEQSANDVLNKVATLELSSSKVGKR